MTKSIFERFGVNPDKTIIRQNLKQLIDSEYPNSFVNIITDPMNRKRVITQHQDGDNDKFIQRLLYYYEFGDESVFEGMIDDVLSVNTGDIASSGFVFGPWLMTDILNLNFNDEVKEVILKVASRRFSSLLELYYRYGFDIKFLGLETTDLPDQVRSSVSDIAITAWAKKFDLVTGNVKPGDAIFGLLGDGRAIWEEKKNSGIGSTGLSLGRSNLLDVSYNAKHSTLKREGDFYKGRFKLSDCPSILEGMSVSEALLSPTRQWALVIREIIVELKSKNALPMLHSISINTIGGATKIKHVGHGICYVKKMPIPSPIFLLIQQESGATWESMYEEFNCNIGVDIVGEDKPELLDAIKIATHNCGLDYCRLGKVRPALGAAPDNVVTLQTPYGEFNY